MRNNRKGLLPEPNAVQIMKSFNNPAMLQILLQPQLRGHGVKPGKLFYEGVNKETLFLVRQGFLIRREAPILFQNPCRHCVCVDTLLHFIQCKKMI